MSISTPNTNTPHIMSHWNGTRLSLFSGAFIFEVLIWQKGYISFMWTLYGLIALVVGGVLYTVRHNTHREALAIGVVYFLAGLVGLCAVVANNNLYTPWATTTVISAVNTYKLQHGYYPENLSDLAPDIIKEVPFARISPWGAFDYRVERVTKDRLLTMNTAFPFFEECTYSFHQNAWVSYCAFSDRLAAQAAKAVQ